MYYVIDGEELFYDMGEKTDFKAFFDKMRRGSNPKTSALNDFNYFKLVFNRMFLKSFCYVFLEQVKHFVV